MPARFNAISMQRCAPSPSLGRRGDVIRIAGKAVADHFGINPGAACEGMFQLFKDDNTGALAHDETIAVIIIGTRCGGRIVIARCGQSLASSKAGQRNPADRRLGTTGYHHIRITESDQTRCVANSMRAG